MEKNPLISIVVPVYNAGLYLAQCIDSIINQSYKNLEILCINDGSTDDSIKILNQYKNRDFRIIVIDKQNEGVSETRNVGLKKAKGDYLMFVDADDWIDADTCEKALQSALEYEADVVMWSYCSETESRVFRKEIFSKKQIFIGNDVKEKLHRRFIGIIKEELAHPESADSLCPVWGKLYKKDLLEGIEFIDLNEIGTYEDGIYNLEAFAKANKVVYLPEYFYHYRRSTTDSITSGYKSKLFEQWNNLFRYMERYIKQNDLPEMYYEALYNRIAISVLGHSLNVAAASKNIFCKIKEIKCIISSDVYRKAYQNFSLNYLPLHWKLFYGFAKYNFATGVFIIGKVIYLIVSR
jgi:glycosyltransferase EpsH